MNPVSGISIQSGSKEQDNSLKNSHKPEDINLIKIASGFMDLLRETIKFEKDMLNSKNPVQISDIKEKNEYKTVKDSLKRIKSKKDIFNFQYDVLFKENSAKKEVFLMPKETVIQEYSHFIEAFISSVNCSRNYADKIRNIALESLPKESNNNLMSLREFKNLCENFVENASNSL